MMANEEALAMENPSLTVDQGTSHLSHDYTVDVSSQLIIALVESCSRDWFGFTLLTNTWECMTLAVH